MTTSIIVYRNPIEAAIWESGMVFPGIVALFTFAIVMFGIMHFTEHHWRRWRPKRTNAYTFAVAIISGCIAGVVFHLMM